MGDRWRKGIQSNESQDQRSTHKPVVETISYGSSYEDVPVDGMNSTPRSDTFRVRDSGYNTDVSPARTSSSTSTPADHFSFDYPENITTTTNSSNNDITARPRSSPTASWSTLNTPLSPRSHSSENPHDLFQQSGMELSESSNLSQSAPESQKYGTGPSPNTVFSQFPDDNAEDDLDEVDQDNSDEEGIPVLPKSMSTSFQDFRGGDEDEPEDDVMTSSEEKEMEERFFFKKVTTPRMSLRRRNYSAPEEGATSTSLPDYATDYINKTSPELISSIKHVCGSLVHDNEDSSSDNDDTHDVDSSTNEEVFTFDRVDIENFEESERRAHTSVGAQAKSPAFPSHLVMDKPPISPSSRYRKGKTNPHKAIPLHLQTAATQTPHRLGAMIQDIVDTPVVLPGEARGPAYMHLRRGSADSRLLKKQMSPLPDIVPMSRDRAQSVPNLQEILLRQQAQRTGRELRRMSDLFFSRRNSQQRLEETPEQASSYPNVVPSFLTRALRFGGSSRSRRGSSVDDISFEADIVDSDS